MAFAQNVTEEDRRAAAHDHDVPPENRQQEQNVGALERMISAGLGAMAVVRALRHPGPGRSLLGLAGTALVWRGATGRCAMYEALGITSADASPASTPLTRELRARSSITIDATADQLTAFCSQIENLPRLCDGLAEVVQSGPDEYRLQDAEAQGWRLQIHEGSPNTLTYHLRSIAGHEAIAVVRMKAAPADRGTEVHASVRLKPHYGAMGAMAAMLRGEHVQQQLTRAMHRLKQIMELGDVFTAVGPSAR